MTKMFCPICGSTRPVWKAGSQLQIGGKAPKQRYKCPACHTTFTVEPLAEPKTRRKR